ncbi:MAG: acyltransferase [Xanthomonadales bacterium]|nr:acyltransferase [Xanthomonadales bacterium]
MSDPVHYARLDAIRGIAALWVMLFHAWQFGTPPGPVPNESLSWLAYQLMAAGWAGVPVFFGLSGFLLTTLALQRPIDTSAAFWTRRAKRILPAYWFQCAMLAALILAGWDIAGVHVRSIDALPSQLLMTYNLHPDGARPWLAPWWSLPVEFAFYLAFPLLVRARGSWIALLIACAALSCLVRWLPPQLWPDSRWPLIVAMHLPGQLDLFVAGMLAAHCHHRYAHAISTRTANLVWTGVVLAIAIWVVLPAWLGAPAPRFVAGSPWWAGWNLALGLLVGAACWSGVRLDHARRRPGALVHALAWTGRSSYSLYLWHLPWVIACAALAAQAPLHPLRGALLFVIALAPSLGTAWLSWRLVELPFLRRTSTARQPPQA